MGMSYARPIPVDRDGAKLQGFPTPTSTLGSVDRENASASSVTSLSVHTTVIEVAAVTTAAGIRWAVNQETSVVTAVSGANFDHIITAGTVRKFVVPRRIQAPQPSAVGLNIQEGLFNGIATISTGIGSVLLSQY